MPYIMARLFSGSSDQSPEQLDGIARQELVPQLLQIPGLRQYSTVQFSDGRVGSFSVYENREAAERGLRVASEWVSSATISAGFAITVFDGLPGSASRAQ